MFDEFYLMPILQFEEVMIGNHEGRLDRLAAATAAGAAARQATNIRKNQEYFKSAVVTPEQLGKDEVKKDEGFSEVDVQVNSACLALGLGPAHQTDTNDWDIMMDVNTKGLM